MAKGKKVRVDELSSALANILTEYGNDVAGATRRAVNEAAREAKKEAQKDSPVGTKKKRKSGYQGKYKKGWTVRETWTRLRSENVVYNRTDYQLTHLLEKGHALPQGGRSRPIPHIRPAEQRAIEKVKKAVEKIAKG